MGKGIRCIAYGKEYESYTHLARAFGISPSAFIRRVSKNGMDIEDALEAVKEEMTKPNHCRHGEITVFGVTYSSINQACKHYNMNFSTVRRKLDKGVSPEEVFSIRPSKHNHYVICNGKWFKSLKAACDEHDVAYHSVLQSLNRNNFKTVEDAVNYHVERKKKIL